MPLLCEACKGRFWAWEEPGKALVWGSFRSGGGQRQDAGSWAGLLRGGRPGGCTRIDRRSQVGPEIEQTREQKDGRLPSTHSVNSVNSPSLENALMTWGFSFFLPTRKTGSQGMRELGDSHTTGRWQSQDGMPDGPNAHPDSCSPELKQACAEGQGDGAGGP